MLFQIAAIAIGSIAAQWIAWRFHLPAIIFLLLFGFILGPVIGFVQPELLMGDLMQPAVGAAVAIILFEGSLSLRFREIREVRQAVRHIVLIGAPLGWFLISMAAHYIAGLSWPVAITFGGILVVTGPTVIIPMLRHAKLSPRVASILKWEGIINDPIGVIFAVLAYEYFHFHEARQAMVEESFIIQNGAILVAEVVGSYLLGRITAYILERGHIPEYLKAPFLVAMVITLFTICNEVLHESGLIAVTVYGMTLANVRVASIEEIRRFKETITLLLVSGVFIILTADLNPSVLLAIDIRGLLFIAAIVFLIRPLTIMVATIGTMMDYKERALVGWIAPRGVVCAAIAGVMGPLLVNAGFPDGEKMLPLAFGIVVITVLLHSFTLKPLSQRLKLSSTKAQGLIIVGASDWTIQMAETLMSKDIPVIIADKEWHHLKPARLANIPVYYGEVLSEETEYNIELSRYGTLLAATDNSAYNSLVCNAFAPELGRENVYQISSGEEEGPERKKLSETLQGRIFIRADKDYTDWWHNYFDNYRFRLTRLNSEEKEAKKETQQDSQFIGTIGKNGLITFRSPEYDLGPKEDDLLLYFSPQDEKVEKPKENGKKKVA